MREKVMVFVSIIIIPAVIAASWFVAYVFAEDYLLLAQYISAIGISYSVLLFALSYKFHVANTPNRDTDTQLHFYEGLFTNSPLPYLIINPKGQVIAANATAAKLFDSTLDKILDVNVFEHLQHEDENFYELTISKMRAGISQRDVELQLCLHPKILKWVSLSLHVNQATNQHLLSLIDITDKKKTDIAKSEFASLVTHQLRTPVAAIRWNVELVEQTLPKPLTDTTVKYFEKISRNVTRMLDLINDFLSVSKLETGTFETTPEIIKMYDYFESVIDEYSGTIKQKNLIVERLYAPEALQITMDSRLLHIIVSNLLSNAIKYTPDNGTVAVQYSATETEINVSIADSGIGIPNEDQAHLFNKFFRASNAIKQRTEGTGLGLYIVKQSVEKLGGTIKLNSIEGKGTTFQATLPLEQ